MFTKLKTISLILIVMLTLGIILAGCGQAKSDEPASAGVTKAATAQTVTETVKELEPVTLKMYSCNFAPSKDTPEVLDELNKNLQKDLNVTLDIQFIPFSDYHTKIPLLFSSGEDFDVITNYDYSINASKGAYLDITDMLGTVTPKMKANYDDLAWKGVTINGKIYAVPSKSNVPYERVMIVRGDILKKAGMDKLSTLDDIDKFLSYVKDNEKEVLPFDGMDWDFSSMDFTNLHTSSGFSSILNGEEPYGTLGFFNLKDPNDTKIYSWEEINDTVLVPYYKKMYSMQQKGLWPKGALQNTAGSLNMLEDGKTAMAINMISSNTDFINIMTQHPDWDIKIFPFNDLKYVSTRVMMNGLSINKNSKNPERALMFIEKMTMDDTYLDLVTFGIKGKHYLVRDDGQYYAPPGVKAEDIGYNGGTWGDWMWIDLRSLFNFGDINPSVKPYIDLAKERASANPLCPFIFEQTPVKNEIAAVQNVFDTYCKPLYFGLVDPDTIMAEYKAKLKAAGIDKIYEEVNKQVEAYLKTTKIIHMV